MAALLVGLRRPLDFHTSVNWNFQAAGTPYPQERQHEEVTSYGRADHFCVAADGDRARIKEIDRKRVISDARRGTWRKKFSDLVVSEQRWPHRLEEEKVTQRIGTIRRNMTAAHDSVCYRGLSQDQKVEKGKLPGI